MPGIKVVYTANWVIICYLPPFAPEKFVEIWQLLLVMGVKSTNPPHLPVPYPYHPWDERHIYLHGWLILMVNVGTVDIPFVPWILWVEIRVHLPSLKLTASLSLKNRLSQKETDRIPTIHFQVRKC